MAKNKRSLQLVSEQEDPAVRDPEMETVPGSSKNRSSAERVMEFEAWHNENRTIMASIQDQIGVMDSRIGGLESKFESLMGCFKKMMGEHGAGQNGVLPQPEGPREGLNNGRVRMGAEQNQIGEIHRRVRTQTAVPELPFMGKWLLEEKGIKMAETTLQRNKPTNNNQETILKIISDTDTFFSGHCPHKNNPGLPIREADVKDEMDGSGLSGSASNIISKSGASMKLVCMEDSDFIKEVKVDGVLESTSHLTAKMVGDSVKDFDLVKDSQWLENVTLIDEKDSHVLADCPVSLYLGSKTPRNVDCSQTPWKGLLCQFKVRHSFAFSDMGYKGVTNENLNGSGIPLVWFRGPDPGGTHCCTEAKIQLLI